MTESSKLAKLKVLNKMKANMNAENWSMNRLLDYFGITEEGYLEFGRIWREMSTASDPESSLRHRDQFLQLKDFVKLIKRVSDIMNLSGKFEINRILKLELPLFGFNFKCRDLEKQNPFGPKHKITLKVHRGDVTRVFLHETKILDSTGSDSEKRMILRQIEKNIQKRFPTRHLMRPYIVQSIQKMTDVEARKLFGIKKVDSRFDSIDNSKKGASSKPDSTKLQSNKKVKFM